MKKLEFRIDDISFLDSEQQYRIPSLKFAQAKFDEWYNTNIESAPVVYAIQDNNLWAEDKNVVTNLHFLNFKKARLIDIQEIKKECVKHEPKRNYHYTQELAPTPICYHCGVELVATWKPVDSSSTD